MRRTFVLGVEEIPAQRRQESRRTQRVRISVARVAASVSLALLPVACGSSSPTTASDLFQEYLKSTNVKGDKFRGATSADRIAEFAAEGTPSEAQIRLLAAESCGEVAEDACLPDKSVSKAAEDFAGPTGKIYKRNILVKRQNGHLELMTLYVTRKADRASELVDSNGKRYSEGLDDFRQHNDLLSAGDQILTPRNITATPGEGEVIAISGHTGLQWEPWLIGGIGIVAVVTVGAGFLLIRTRRGGFSFD
jgi:hypothetical protein